MRIPPIAMTAQTPIGPRPVSVEPRPPVSIVRRSGDYQFTVLDAAGGKHPRTLVAKVERNHLWRGLAQDMAGVDVQFSIKVGGVWRDLGVATSDSFAFARLPFPKDLELSPGLYEIQVREAGTAARDDGSTGRVLITGDKPVLAVSLDGTVLTARPGILGFLARHNPFKKKQEIVPGAGEALHRLSKLYQIVYVAPLRDESTLEVLRKNLFSTGLIPKGPIFTNDFGWRLKEYSRTASYDRLREFMDGVLADLRGFNGAAVVGGIGRTDQDRIDRQIMDRHGLENLTVPDTHRPWWQFGKKSRSDRRRRLMSAWSGIEDHFVKKHDHLRASALALHERQFHAHPHIRLQTELDLVSNAVLSMNNSAKLYVDGPEALEAVSSLFEGAESVFSEIYEFGPDTVGNAFAEIFKKLASAGKPVRITADFIGSDGWHPKSMSFFSKMKAKGVHVVRFGFVMAEILAFLDALFFRTHRKVAAVKTKGPEGRIRHRAVLGGRNWKAPYFFGTNDFTPIVEGPVVRDVVHHLTQVADKFSGSRLTPKERAAFAVESPDPHPDGQPLRYVAQYPKDGQSIQRTFLSMLRNPDSGAFMMESPFHMMRDLEREVLAVKTEHPEKNIVWVMGTHHEEKYKILDAYTHVLGLRLKKRGIRTLIGPLNEQGMSPMHSKIFSDGVNLAVCSWNPDEQSLKDLETCLVVTPHPDDPRTTAAIEDMLDRGLRKDIAEGIDLEEWLQKLLKRSGFWTRLRISFLLWFAGKTERYVHYFL